MAGPSDARIGSGIGSLLGMGLKTFLLDPYLRDRENKAQLEQEESLIKQKERLVTIPKEKRAAAETERTLGIEQEGWGEALQGMGFDLPKQPPVGITRGGERMELGPTELHDTGVEEELGAVGQALGIQTPREAPPRISKEVGTAMLKERDLKRKAKEAGGDDAPGNIWEAAAAATKGQGPTAQTDWVAKKEAEKTGVKKSAELHEKGERPLRESMGEKGKEEMQFSQDVIDSLTRMKQYYDAGASESVGPIRGGEKLSYLRRAVGMGANFEAEFRAEAGELTSRVVKMFSGAQSSDPERRHIAATLPQGNEASLEDFEGKHFRSLTAAKYLRRRKQALQSMTQNQVNKLMSEGTLDEYITKKAGGRPDWLQTLMKEDAARKIGETLVAPNGRTLVWNGNGWVAAREQ